MKLIPDSVSDPKAELVWKGLTQSELDAAYDQVAYASNLHEVLDRYSQRSERTRATLGEPRRFSYGETAIEMLDWFAPAAPGAPINIFIHGGAWRTGDARQYHFPAELFVPAGAHCVVPDFASVLDTCGDLLPMAQQLQRAISWVAWNAGRFDADPKQIYLSSHSSGAHLAACVALTDWSNEFGLPDDLIKGVLCCGGIYDLKPVLLSSRRRYLSVPADIEDQLSPNRHVEKLSMPVCVAYGELESPEFRRQSIEFASNLDAHGRLVSLFEHPRLNHFEILETLTDPQQLLGREALRQMGLMKID